MAYKDNAITPVKPGRKFPSTVESSARLTYSWPSHNGERQQTRALKHLSLIEQEVLEGSVERT